MFTHNTRTHSLSVSLSLSLSLTLTSADKSRRCSALEYSDGKLRPWQSHMGKRQKFHHLCVARCRTHTHTHSHTHSHTNTLIHDLVQSITISLIIVQTHGMQDFTSCALAFTVASGLWFEFASTVTPFSAFQPHRQEYLPHRAHCNGR